MLGFPDLSISADLRLLAKEYDLGGIILFGRNIEEPEQVAELLFALCGHRQAALVLVTHDMTLASRCDKQLRLEKGRVSGASQ